MKLTLDQWFSHIQNMHHQCIDFGLDRISVVAERLHLKTFQCPVITVAGTNGKGSCVKTLESIYSYAGYKTGLYTSPHLMNFNERIRINNHDVSNSDLVVAFETIDNARRGITLSFFEFTTLTALFLFQQASLNVIILEIGLGGRLDAVNIVESDVAVVTSIALDHMEYLGNDRESIAFEKASIARAGKPLICGEENPPAAIAKTAQEKNAILIQVNRDYCYEIVENALCRVEFLPTKVHYFFPKPSLKLQNVATAIAVIETVKQALPVSEKNITDGIKNTEWPGRFEIVTSPFSCILDVAHNPHASQWLSEQYAQLPRVKKTIAVVGMLKDKNMIDTLKPLLPFVDLWCVCNLLSVSNDRGSDGIVMRNFLGSQGKACYTFSTVVDAMEYVSTCERDRVLIFGSFYTVAAAKQWLHHENMDEIRV